jgi:methylenetetrahydrofolate dehydrogenase (NADP+)/methenyltetrahydrofolate cyclohydrolase
MTAQLIDGNALSNRSAPKWRSRAAALTARGVTRPAWPSSWWARTRPGRLRAQQGQGLPRKRLALGAREVRRHLTEAALLARIEALNADPAIHGILVQMPLPQAHRPAR